MKPQPPLPDGQGRTGRQDVNLLWLNHLTIRGVEDPHSGGAAEDLGQHTFVAGGKVGHDDKRHAVVCRHSPEELLQRFDATCRGADADDGQIGCHAFTLFLHFPLGNGFSGGSQFLCDTRRAPKTRVGSFHHQQRPRAADD